MPIIPFCYNCLMLSRYISIQWLQRLFVFLFFLFLPTQLGKHFFFDFSYINGIRIDYLAPTLYLLDILAVGLFVLNWRVVVDYLKKHAQILLISTVFGAVNILLSKEPMIALYTLVRFVEMYFLFIVFRNWKSPKMALLPLFICSVVELGLSLYHIWAGQSVQGIFYWLGERAFSASTPGIATISLFGNQVLRPYGTFSHPNSMGGFYLLIYTFVLWFFSEKLSRNLSIIRFGLLLVSSSLILISFSKIAILGFMLVNAYYLVKEIRLDCRLCKIARILSLGVVSLIFLSGQSDILSWDKRVLLIKQSAGVLVAHPMFGVGLGNSLYYQSQLTGILPYSFIQPVHNVFLLFITEVGLVGVALALFLFLQPRRLPPRLLLWCLIVIGITGFFDHYWLTLIQNQLAMGVILGLALHTRKQGGT